MGTRPTAENMDGMQLVADQGWKQTLEVTTLYFSLDLQTGPKWFCRVNDLLFRALLYLLEPIWPQCEHSRGATPDK